MSEEKITMQDLAEHIAFLEGIAVTTFALLIAKSPDTQQSDTRLLMAPHIAEDEYGIGARYAARQRQFAARVEAVLAALRET